MRTGLGAWAIPSARDSGWACLLIAVRIWTGNIPTIFPGEAPPRELPATGYGLDVQWGRGPWNVYGEMAHFQMTYKAIPTYNVQTGYAEVRRVLNPRWYAAVRAGYNHPLVYPGSESYEVAAGFRPTANQILKVGYICEPYSGSTTDHGVTIQFVTSFRAFGFAGVGARHACP